MGAAQNYTVQILDSSTMCAEWTGTDWTVCLDTYPDSLYGDRVTINGAEDDAPGAILVAARAAFINRAYKLMPAKPTTVEL